MTTTPKPAEIRGAFTIDRIETYRHSARVVEWVVNGPLTNRRAFSTRTAARRYCDVRTHRPSTLKPAREPAMPSTSIDDPIAMHLHQTKRVIESNRRDLIVAMRRLAKRLMENADVLETDPARLPDSLGYLAPTSLSGDVDRLAMTVYAAEQEHGRLLLVAEEVARRAAHDAGMAAAAAAAITIPACLNCGGPLILGLNSDFCTARCEAAHRAVANQTK